MIDIQGVTVAKVNDKIQLQSVETWFDPMEMFRQISPQGVVTRQAATAAGAFGSSGTGDGVGMSGARAPSAPPPVPRKPANIVPVVEARIPRWHVVRADRKRSTEYMYRYLLRNELCELWRTGSSVHWVVRTLETTNPR